MMSPWKTLQRRIILAYSKFLTIEVHTIQLPTGQIISNWPWIITPDFVNVVAITPTGDFLCFQQPKYAVPDLSLALPGGYLEPGELPLTAARRELLEETGYEAPIWHSLGSYAVDGNRGAGTAHLFLAQNAQPVAPINADDLEEQDFLTLTRTELETALQNHRFKVLSWTAAATLALSFTAQGHITG